MCSATITDWTHYLRQLLGEAVDEEQTVIGGPAIIVEVDETKFANENTIEEEARRVWVIAGIERTPLKKIFVVEIPERNKSNITQILSKYIREASIFYTDCWKAYVPACQALSLVHKTVNHFKDFVYKDDGTHTNT
ncbi:hypothetical protein H311_00058 [Anncaliia algerae PRA109]|nr:hypothetical protein H311_00058 [Anncaliia algerae PRA109]